MAKAESRSITRRSLVAGSAAVPAAMVAAYVPGGAVARMKRSAIRDSELLPAPDFASASASASANASFGLQDGDPIHAAIEAHAHAYAAYEAYRTAEPEDEVGLEPLIEIERAAADAVAATVPATLQGTAAALAYVHLLHARDNYPLLDDYGCYVLIASADTALQRMLECRAE
jgi:hypothetical protein